MAEERESSFSGVEVERIASVAISPRRSVVVRLMALDGRPAVDVRVFQVRGGEGAEPLPTGKGIWIPFREGSSAISQIGQALIDADDQIEARSEAAGEVEEVASTG